MRRSLHSETVSHQCVFAYAVHTQTSGFSSRKCRQTPQTHCHKAKSYLNFYLFALCFKISVQKKLLQYTDNYFDSVGTVMSLEIRVGAVPLLCCPIIPLADILNTYTINNNNNNKNSHCGKIYLSLTNHPGQLSLAIPTWVGAMSTSQIAVMLCDWGVKADMVLFAGNTV